MNIKQLIKLEGKADKWLLPVEMVMMAYALLTVMVILFTWTNIHNPSDLLWSRLSVVMTTVAVWVVFRLWPCRLMYLVRIIVLFAYLGWWYPDTYELNKQFPNLDPIFAQWDQSIFGFQPALIWSQRFPSPIVSELMDMGYSMYFPMFVGLVFYVFFRRYEQFHRTAFIILSSFYIYYTIYVFLPVTGPQYYYLAAGLDNIAAGVFPDVGNYFSNCMDVLPSPGYKDGLFYQLVQSAHDAGERPTAAFPSSHVGVSTITMLMAIRLKEWKIVLLYAIPYLFLCMATIYIQAHYAVDAFAGFVSAIMVFFLLDWVYKKYL